MTPPSPPPSATSPPINPTHPSSTHHSPQATTTARTYYDSPDADTFYHTIWGGTDIHIGLYSPPSTNITLASHNTVTHMASSLHPPLTSETHILDLGSGYGGAARHLAQTYGCKVTCLNLSAVENERNQEKTKEAQLGHLVHVVEGSFEDIPMEDGSVDVVWSQDAFLHSGQRERVVEEIARVSMKEGGRVIFTDPMAAKGADVGALAPILSRLHLESLGSVEFYEREFKKHGYEEMVFEDRTDQLVVHYGRVLQELEEREGELKGMISKEYVRNMKTGLGHWIEGGKGGKLSWGILQFSRKGT